MISGTTIGIGIAAAIIAALACYFAHQRAEEKRWKALERYACGLIIINMAFAFPVFATLDVAVAGILYGLLWLIGGASGLATWLAYANDKQDSDDALFQAGRALGRIEHELGADESERLD